MTTGTNNIFTQTVVSYDTISLTLEGYSQLALIDLTKLNSDGNQTSNILNNIDLDINTNIVPKKSSTFINYNCDINFSVDVGMDFPNFLQRPYPNLTLFKKADEFSDEISKLNDTIIKIFQQMECCGISDEYNKTVVPFFRYLASTPEHKDCGNSPDLAPDSCGVPDGIMEPILQAVKNITKVYTAIEPIFCLIAPIPGNPWLPVDFNWMMPIMPYLQSFSSFMDYIMSGALFDVIIDPVKNLNRMLISCTESSSENNFNEIDTNSNELIKLMEKIKETEESINNISTPKTVNQEEALKLTQSKLNNEAAHKKLLQQTIVRNKYQTFNITNDYYEINTQLSNIRNSGRGICICIMKSLDLEIRLPKFPTAKIRILPQSANESYKLEANDLLKYKNEETYTLTFEDIYKDSFTNSGTVDTNFSNKKHINLTTNLTTDMDFINKFKIFIEKSSQTKSGYDYNSTISLIENSQLVNHIPTSDFIERYTNSLPKLSFFYTDKSEYLKKVIDQYDTAILNTTTMTPSEVLESNRNFINKIKQLEDQEFKIKSKLDEIYSKDKENWYEAKSKADLEFKKLKVQAGNVNYDIENLRLQQMYNDFFGSYKDMNIAIDINDARIQEKFWIYSDLNDTDLYTITLNYLNKRIFLFGSSDTNYKDYISEQLNSRGIELSTILGRNNLTVDVTKSLDDQLQEMSSKINDLTDPTTAKYKTYKEDISNFLNAPFGLYLKDYLFRNYPKDIKLEHNDIYFMSSFHVIDEAISKINSTLPAYVFSSGEQANVLFYTIQILQIEKYKLKLFEILEKNVAFDFYLAYYPTVDCTCEDLVCKLLQMIVEYLLRYIRKMIAQILQLVMEYLIPQWLRALIDLIIYKLKCVLEAVYMKQNLNLIDTVYSDLLQSMKYRVSNYPYDGCVDKALQDALNKIKKNNDNGNNLLADPNAKPKTAEDELKNHNVKIDFVDFNKKPIPITRLSNWKNISLKIEVDIGATIEYVFISDKTIPGETTQTSLTLTEAKKNIMYIYNIPLDKIISGKVKAVVKSNKPFADEKIKFDEASIVIDDFLDKSTMRLILSDYRTSDRNIFLESNKNTLLISFNVVAINTIGDPATNFNLIPKYIKTIVLTDNPPFGSNIISLPEKLFKIEDIINDSSFTYNKENNLFSFVADCTDFFPANRNINGIVETFNIYNGLTHSAQDIIFCEETDVVFDPKGYLNNTTKKFIDTISYSDFVQAPFNTNDEENKNNEPGDINNIEVRKDNPVIYDCSILPNSTGTSFLIQPLYDELHETWEATGLI